MFYNTKKSLKTNLIYFYQSSKTQNGKINSTNTSTVSTVLITFITFIKKNIIFLNICFQINLLFHNYMNKVNYCDEYFLISFVKNLSDSDNFFRYL